jgi:SH3-like domain-containing protein
MHRRGSIRWRARARSSAADDHSPGVARLDQGVVVELLEPPANGYAHVRHRDGTTGWVKVSEVWGL